MKPKKIKKKTKKQAEEKIAKTEMRKIADKIIKRHILWAMGAGAIPIPIVDAIGVTSIQIDMYDNYVNYMKLIIRKIRVRALFLQLPEEV